MIFLLGTKFPSQQPPRYITLACAFTFSKQPHAMRSSSFICRKDSFHDTNHNPLLQSSFTSSPSFSSKSSLSLSNNNDEVESALSKKLLSVQECIDIKEKEKDNNNVVFLDASWHLGGERDGRMEYEAGPRIQGARYFDIDDISSKKGSPLNPKGLPHMRPSKNLFAAAMTALNIQNDDHIIIYGTEGCIFIQRAAYTIRNMGHNQSKVHLMQGSLKEWIDLSGDVDTQPIKAISAMNLNEGDENKNGYKAKEASQFCDIDQVMKTVQAAMTDDGIDVDTIVLDARGSGRFKGEAAEPRPGMRKGHMPGSINVPFMNLLEPNNLLKLKSSTELRQAFLSSGIDIDDTKTKLILSCGSGVSACVLAAALEECGRDPTSTYVYDGSWSEWGSETNTPIVLS